MTAVVIVLALLSGQTTSSTALQTSAAAVSEVRTNGSSDDTSQRPPPVGDPPPLLGPMDGPPIPEPTPPAGEPTPPLPAPEATQHLLPPAVVPAWGALVGAIGGGLGASVGAAYIFGDIAGLRLDTTVSSDLLSFAILLSTPAMAALVAGFVVVGLVVPEPRVEHFGNVAACSAAGCVGTWLLLGLGLGGGAGCGTAACPRGNDCDGCGNATGNAGRGGIDDSVGLPAAAAAGIGAMLGLGAGFVIGKAMDEEAGGGETLSQRYGAAIGIVVGGALGGGVGGLFVGTEIMLKRPRIVPRGGDSDEGLGELRL